MSKTPPFQGMTILLGLELSLGDLPQVLTDLGCNVTVMPVQYDAVISYDAWKIPPETSQDEVVKYVKTVLKQIKVMKHVQNPTPKESTDPVHKVSRKRTKKSTVEVTDEPSRPATKLDDTASDTGC